MKRALITGITGQDGSYLAELLLDKGYEVHGVVRRVAIEDPEHRLWRILHLKDRLHLHAASLESLPSIYRVFQAVKPHECYHLAAQSEMFGKVAEVPQNEMTRFHPRSAYGISKVAGFDLTRNYREAYSIRASSGILYNHESPRRGFEFVTRKITSQAARIKLGLTKEVRLGNLDARRDWGHAREYVRAMWLMLQQDEPEDYVIATGEQHSVREFAELAFAHLGLDYRDHVVVDPQFQRPADVETLLGDASKARKKLGWKYGVTFKELVQEMVEADLARLKSVRP